MNKLNVALVTPPISGHKFRGTGIYGEELFEALKKSEALTVSYVKYGSNLIKYDVVHYPYFDPFFLTFPLIKSKSSVVTVHDLIPLSYPDKFPRGIRGELKWIIQRQSLKGAKAVITDSYASKKDIVKFTGLSCGKINVIYLGVRKEFKVISYQKTLDEIRRKYELPQNFILYVGDVNYNKNISGIIKSFSEATKIVKDLHLVFVGNGFINESIQLSEINELVSSLSLDKKVMRLGFIELLDLVAIYNLAKVYLQPSFAEGFGLPILEAMACGCPVVTSNTSSIPEITGEAAINFDPKDYLKISQSIIDLVGNNLLRSQIIKKGLEKVKEFNWEKCAGETVNIYKSISE